MERVLGRLGGWIRDQSVNNWLVAQTVVIFANVMVTGILCAFSIVVPGLFVLALLAAATLTALAVFMSKARIETFPPHPQMFLKFIHSAVRAAGGGGGDAYLSEFERVISQDWAEDQFGKSTVVDINIKRSVHNDAQTIVIVSDAFQQVQSPSHSGSFIELPVHDENSNWLATVTVTAPQRADLFRMDDMKFWTEVWRIWEPPLRAYLQDN